MPPSRSGAPWPTMSPKYPGLVLLRNADRRTLRLSFTTYAPDRIREGLSRLGTTWGTGRVAWGHALPLQHRTRRCDLCRSLAATRHPRAADHLRSLLSWLSWGITMALAVGAVIDMNRERRGVLVDADSPQSVKKAKKAQRLQFRSQKALADTQDHAKDARH